MIATLEIVVMFLLLIIPALIYKQWWLAGLFVVCGLALGVAEYLSIQHTGHSISQQFWSLAKTHKGKAITIVSCMAAAWALLIIHFIVR